MRRSVKRLSERGFPMFAMFTLSQLEDRIWSLGRSLWRFKGKARKERLAELHDLFEERRRRRAQTM